MIPRLSGKNRTDQANASCGLCVKLKNQRKFKPIRSGCRTCSVATAENRIVYAMFSNLL
ncbi:hypothetical protein B4099_2867 [Heyndrickxia coagulans]|uniref:Uncharacterized protein n=1 Tax=Heyndrickxia coagulans TaxID=1398 RepID=A0A150K0X0_HEYCO|nr:hypothetical protein B4099_2867 [Heyndrickxia coagulans]